MAAVILFNQKEKYTIMTDGIDRDCTLSIEQYKPDISDLEISLSDYTYKYAGVPAEPSVYVKEGLYELVRNTDYTVEYRNNTAPGTGTVIIEGIGNYTGTKEITFTIVKNNGSGQAVSQIDSSPSKEITTDLPSVKLTKPAAKKKAVTVKWKKISSTNKKKIQGLEIQVATDKYFKNIVKSTDATKTATSKVIKKLKSKKTYWVRVRAYRNSSDGKHISKWAVKKVKTK